MFHVDFSRWRIIGTFFLLLVFSFFTFGLTMDPSNVQTFPVPFPRAQDASLSAEASQRSVVVQPTLMPSPSPAIRVKTVIDGDTIELEDGRRLRYIGIDTPETKYPSQPIECFGQGAYEKNKTLVEGKEVRLEKDVSETDKYGRLLRYVYVDEIMINELLVKEGYANATSYPPDIKYQDLFRKAEQEAREAEKGLWGTACKVEPTPQPTPKPTVKPIQQPIQSPIQSIAPVSGGCLYSCSGPDRDCADFSSHSQAQEFFDCCGFTTTYDPMKLDSVGVGDGVACESR